jgi:hypothetical protein
MHPDQAIRIQLVDEENKPLPVSDVMVEIQFFTKGDYRFGFKMGRTNEMGELKISYADVERLRAENAQRFLMDYNTNLEQCDSTVRIEIPSERQLRDASQAAHKAYGTEPEWAKAWPSNYRIESKPLLVQLDGPTTNARMPSKRLQI